MHKWIASACAAAVLSFSVVSAQTYPQTPNQQPTTRSAPATKSGQRTTNRSVANSSQPITVTGCVMRGSRGSQTASAGRTTANTGGWMLSNATMSNAAANQTSSINSSTSRSGSPSKEGTSANNRNGTARSGVSGSTSTVVGTSGTNATIGGNIDTEAHGAGTLGATDQAGSTVGAGVTAGVTSDADNPQNSQNRGTYGNEQNRGTYGSGQTTSGTSETGSAGAATSYQLSGVTNPNEYSGKRVEITGTVINARAGASSRRSSNASSGNSAMPMLRVTSVRVLGENCQ